MYYQLGRNFFVPKFHVGRQSVVPTPLDVPCNQIMAHALKEEKCRWLSSSIIFIKARTSK